MLLRTFFLPVPDPYGLGRGWGGAPSFLSCSGPLPRPSPPPVTWAGFPFPRPRAASPCTRLARWRRGGGAFRALLPPPWWRGGVDRGVRGQQPGTEARSACQASRELTAVGFSHFQLGCQRRLLNSLFLRRFSHCCSSAGALHLFK